MTSKDELREAYTYGVDKSKPGGDKTALTITKGNKLFTFVGEEAEAILNLLEGEKQKAVTSALEEERRAVMGLSNHMKFDRAIFIAEKRGYEKALNDRNKLDNVKIALATLNKEPNKGEDVDG